VACGTLRVMDVIFAAELWLWDARRHDAWTFVTVPPELSDDIRARYGGGSGRGFGAVKVQVTIGATTWRTSVFPGGGGAPYALPVKKAVLRSEGLEAGDGVTVALRVLDG
jgi:Domain of unknown function (DUF1905)